ncbi:MAG: methyltransferase domain-containing protein [Oscillospiraceae bacterium]|nr:methyltransferase domain-containing protein [Oscillospiraceae bacterium]
MKRTTRTAQTGDRKGRPNKKTVPTHRKATMTTKIIFTCHEFFCDAALQEFMSVSTSLKFIKWLDVGVGLLECEVTFSEISVLFKNAKLIFLRHIFPAQYVISHKNFQKISDVQDYAFIKDFASNASKQEPFSIQLRAVRGSATHNSTEISRKIADHLKAVGYTEDKRHPENIISVFIGETNFYIGISKPGENLSIWSGGMRRYAMRDDTISRSAFKLMEALESYPIDLREGGRALDLGAAPGGWTNVLLEQGLHVVAVDTVSLDPVLLANKKVEYFNGRAHDYLKTSSKKFDIIVNDMSMNIVSSVRLVCSIKNRLGDGGHVIFTLKLKSQDKLDKIKDSLAQLGRIFDVVFVKHLSHNRSEITIILQKR